VLEPVLSHNQPTAEVALTLLNPGRHPRRVEQGERAMPAPTPSVNPPIWVFTTRLLFELVNISTMPTGKSYKPSSYLYARRGEAEGVFKKGLRLKNAVAIKRMTFDGDNWELVAEVPSETSPDAKYTVAIFVPLDFECSCPHGQHRFNPCKHVYAVVLKALEISGADVRDPIIWHYVYEGLNRLAYHKAKTQRNFA
jgi:hypothetical protein